MKVLCTEVLEVTFVQHFDLLNGRHSLISDFAIKPESFKALHDQPEVDPAIQLDCRRELSAHGLMREERELLNLLKVNLVLYCRYIGTYRHHVLRAASDFLDHFLRAASNF